MKLEFSRQNLRKILECQNPYKCVQYGGRDGHEDGPTDMAKMTVTFRNFV